MVSDHAEYMGVFNQMSNPDSPLSKTEIAKGVNSPDANVRLQTFARFLNDMSAGKRDPQLSDPALARTVWAEIIKAAEANYVPGKFTTFAGFEWTSNPQKRNLHRVIVFRDTEHLPDMALSALDSDDPEVLWKWMDDQRARARPCLPSLTTATPATASCSIWSSVTASPSTRPTTRPAPPTNRSMKSPRSRARRRPHPSCRRPTSSPASNCGTTRSRRTLSVRRMPGAATSARPCWMA